MDKMSDNAICGVCGKGMTSRGIKRHLGSCLDKNIDKIVDQTKQKPGVYHLRVEPGYGGSTYWLHLAVDQNINLEKLDDFLRNIWLECCGHMSAFFSGRAFVSDELPLSMKIGQVLEPGQSLPYVYDFGSETNLVITALSSHPGKLKGKKKIAVLARNPEPEIMCDECSSNRAEYICHECLMDRDTGLLCPSCLEKHDCEEEMIVRVMNSPRSGVCAYGAEHV